MVDPNDAKKWDAIHEKTEKEGLRYSKYAEEKEKLFPRGSIICELGGGTGADAIYFLRNGHSVILLDISEFALKVAKKLAEQNKVADKLKVVQADFGIHQLPVADSSIDVVYSRISLNYFGNKQTVILFGDIFRLIKSGGNAYISFKSPDDVKEIEFLEKTTTLYEPQVYIDGSQLRSRFSKDKLEEMLKEAGVTNFSVTPYQEDLGGGQTLFVNDIHFTKA